MPTKQIIPPARRKAYLADSATIAFWRRNPVIAARDLLGIELLDSQKYVLEGSWNASRAVWACSRNWGKSFVADIIILLKALLYPGLNCYIVSNVGEQAKATFNKLIEIVTRSGATAMSFKDLKDIASYETVKGPTNKTGFSKKPSGYEVHFWNGSAIFTVNSSVDNIRGKRADVILFDEAAYCSSELISVVEAFATQSSDFVTSTSQDYDPELEPLRCPKLLIYASSQGSMSSYFYSVYKDAAKEWLCGKRSSFIVDMTCDTAIETYLYGKRYTPLLKREKVEAALKADRFRAQREYYNLPTNESSASSIVKWDVIRHNETFDLPEYGWKPNYTYALALDPARVNDNSVAGVLKMYKDPDKGWVGDVINVENYVDANSENHYKLDANRQLEKFRQLIRAYCDDPILYSSIDSISIDAGSGGGGVSTYADSLLNPWTDDGGVEYRGLIDTDYDIYSTSNYQELYPDAVNKLRLLSPRKYRTTMVQEFIDLMNAGLIHFTRECRSDTIAIIEGNDDNGDEILKEIDLDEQQLLSLKNIDLMKTEIVSIQKTENAEKTSVTYALSKDKQNTFHDDRFYVAIMLAHALYIKRQGAALESRKIEEENIAFAPLCVSAIAM